jgi:hypothetical protein
MPQPQNGTATMAQGLTRPTFAKTSIKQTTLHGEESFNDLCHG